MVEQERAVPSKEGGGRRWSIDNLFLDQDGIPTIVEVKRQTDTRLRREVVGQILEYAANAVKHWPIDELRSTFERNCALADKVPDDELRAKLSLESDVTEFWQRVDANLKEGRIRMLLVADSIPSEVRSIVEFLNKQMTQAEILAVELRQFEGEGLQTIVPLIHGQTEEAQQKKALGPPRDWTEQQVFDALLSRQGEPVARAAEEIVKWLKARTRIWCGRGRKEGSIRANVRTQKGEINPINIWTYGKVEINFNALANSSFQEPEKRRELLIRLNQIDGLSLPDDAIGRYPSIPLQLFTTETNRTHLFAAFQWLFSEIQ